jgi:hypothetical protein
LLTCRYATTPGIAFLPHRRTFFLAALSAVRLKTKEFLPCLKVALSALLPVRVRAGQLMPPAQLASTGTF